MIKVVSVTRQFMRARSMGQAGTLAGYISTAVAVGLFCLIAGSLRAQNMMTRLNDPAAISWYNQHFEGLEDSVQRYQEAMKQPQVPAQRRATLAAYQKALARYRGAMRLFVLHHRQQDTAAKALLISCFRNIEINQDTLYALAGLLQATGATNRYAVYLHQELKGRANNQVGQPFHYFTMPDASGSPINTAQYKGQYMLVLFWASWCGPCRAEMPAFLQTYHQFKNKGLEVVALSVDTDKAAWLHAKNQDRTDWVNVFDNKGWNGPVVRSFAIHRIPQNILIGPEGKIVAKNISPQGLSKLLTKAAATIAR